MPNRKEDLDFKFDCVDKVKDKIVVENNHYNIPMIKTYFSPTDKDHLKNKE